MPTIKTRLHTYSYNLAIPEQAAAYEALVAERRAAGVHWLKASPGPQRIDYADGEVELDTIRLFSNQWNTATQRVFDWYETARFDGRGRAITQYRDGHWLEITDEMRRLRETTFVCGYCGRLYQEDEARETFCTACFDSSYLKESDLHLLRLLPVALHLPMRPALTEEERVKLTPPYVEAQIRSTTDRARKAQKRTMIAVEEEYRNACIARDGISWLVDRGISVENVQFSRRDSAFEFGWMHKIEPSVAARLRTLLFVFPSTWRIVCTDGSTVKSEDCSMPASNDERVDSNALVGEV